MTTEVVRYSVEHRGAWNSVVSNSKNGIFLFDRDYIEYHSDRFVDFSAIVFVDGRPIALLPASFDAESRLATSHRGLTFGGVVLRHDVRGQMALDLIDACLDALRSWGAVELLVRMLPHYLTLYPAGELEYALWRRGFTLVRRDLSSAMPLPARLKLNSSKKQALAKARRAGLVVQDGSITEFHSLLSDVLLARHAVKPVHSLADLECLASRFPKNILLRSVQCDGMILAGALIFRYPTTWHTQYLAASDAARENGALDCVIASAIDEASHEGAAWFSFGVSTENEGRELNNGLLWQKESFGARSVSHDFMRGYL